MQGDAPRMRLSTARYRASFHVVSPRGVAHNPRMRLTLRPRAWRLVLVLVLCVLSAQVVAQSDADVLRAKDAFDRGDPRRLDALAPALAGHILEPYVTYWQLKLGLDDADPAAVQAFLARNAGAPLADRLRVEWLKSLARRGSFDFYDQEIASVVGDDLELACLAAQRRDRAVPPAALDALRAAWFTGQSTPDACDAPFAALFAQGRLTNADRRARMRLASEAGNMRLAQAQGAEMPGQERVTPREFAQVDRDPMRALVKNPFAWRTPAGHDLALYALERAARKDPAGARAVWLRLRERATPDERAYGDRRVAYHAARQLDPSAHEWFRASGPPAGSADELAWRARAALRVRAWSDVAETIAAMSPADQQDAAWRYWKARALAAAGRADDARALYAGLASDLGFYGLLASEALGRGAAQLTALRLQPQSPDPVALAAFAARYDVRRVAKLFELDMRPEALREWAYATRYQGDEGLLLAAEHARRVGLYDRAINAAERTVSRHDYALRYLAPFRAEFGAASRDQGVDEALLYGIARQESRFVPDIVSSAGAVGLMQLMPSTARWVAGKLASTDFQPANIASVELNTQFGAYYFRYWHDRFDQRPALTAAAYNAGPARAQSWRPAAAPLEGAVWVETIPLNETRDYVKKVLANTVLYARVLNQPYVSLTDRLGAVTPRGSDVAALAAQTP